MRRSEYPQAGDNLTRTTSEHAAGGALEELTPTSVVVGVVVASLSLCVRIPRVASSSRKLERWQR